MKLRLFASFVLALALLTGASGVWGQDGGTGEGSWNITQPPVVEPQQAPPAEPAEPPAPPTPGIGWPEDGRRLEEMAVQGEQPMPPSIEGMEMSALDIGGFVYALRGSDTGSFIDRFAADAATGSLIYLGSTATGQNGGSWWGAHMLAYDAVNYRLYAVHDVSSTITAYSVDRASGWLTPLPGSPIALGSGLWVGIAVHPSGSPLAVINAADGSQSVSTFNVTAVATRGAPTVRIDLVGNYSTSGASGTAAPYSLAFSPDGRYLYTGGNSDVYMAGFRVYPYSGALVPLTDSPYDMGVEYPLAYAIDPGGRLFLSGWGSQSSKIATTSDGIPTVVHTLSSNGLNQAIGGLYHPGGFYLVTDRDANQVGVYRISGSGAGSTLAAVSGSPFATGGAYTQGLATNSSGSVVYALNSNSRDITRFSFDPGSGMLSGAEITPTPGTEGALQGIAYAQYNPPPATGGFVFALRRDSAGDNHIDRYKANPEGALALLGSTPTGGKGLNFITVPHYLAYDAVNARLFALNDDPASHSVSVFSVDPTNGALASLYTIPLADATWYGLAIHPTGSPLVVLGSNSIASYQILPTGAIEAAGSPYTTGSAYPFDVIFSQDGEYLYTGGNVGNFLAGFAVNTTSGVLTALSGSPFDMGMWGMAYVTDGLGRMFLSEFGGSSSRIATTSAGVPTVVHTLSSNGLSQPVFGLLHPSGFYMAANREGVNSVGVFRIEGSGAGSTLAAVPGSPFATGGTMTHYLAVNETGKVLYAGNRESGNITRFAVNVFSGDLANVETTVPVSENSLLLGTVYVPRVIPGGFVYTLQNNASAPNMIYGYRLDQATGALSLLHGFPIETGGDGDYSGRHQGLAFDARNRRLYALNGGSYSLSAFTVDEFTGGLAPMPFSPYALPDTGMLLSVAVHPSGSPVLIGAMSEHLSSYTVTGSAINPAPGSPLMLPAGTGVVSGISFSQDGNFAYTGEMALNGMSVNPSSGAIALVAGSPFFTDGNPVPGATDATGRLFTALWSGAAMRVSTLDASGVATTVHTTEFPEINSCTHSTRHPSDYLVVACQTGRVGSFKINGSGAGTTLAETGFSSMPSFGWDANVPVFDETYRYLVVMNRSNNLTSYAFNNGNGGLYPAGFLPLGASGSNILTGLVYARFRMTVYLPMINRK